MFDELFCESCWICKISFIATTNLRKWTKDGTRHEAIINKQQRRPPQIYPTSHRTLHYMRCTDSLSWSYLAWCEVCKKTVSAFHPHLFNLWNVEFFNFISASGDDKIWGKLTLSINTISSCGAGAGAGCRAGVDQNNNPALEDTLPTLHLSSLTVTALSSSHKETIRKRIKAVMFYVSDSLCILLQ